VRLALSYLLPFLEVFDGWEGCGNASAPLLRRRGGMSDYSWYTVRGGSEYTGAGWGRPRVEVILESLGSSLRVV
jgi:hypothetical protein